MIDRPLYLKMVRHKIYLEAKEIPQTGIKTLQVIPVDNISKDKEEKISGLIKRVQLF